MDYSVSLLAQFLSGSRLGLISLVTRLAKALYGQVGDQGGQIRDQVGQGQGQELDNKITIIDYAKTADISAEYQDIMLQPLCSTLLQSTLT